VTASAPIVWLAEYLEDGVCMFRIGRAGDELIAEWIGTARLCARRDGTGVRFLPEPGAAELELEKIRNGSATLLLRHLEGKLALHGAVVAARGAAVVLLGRSGQGKSTLAAAACGAGAALFADDAVAIDAGPDGGWQVTALERMHWIDADARRALGRREEPPEQRPWRGKWPSPADTAGAGRVRVAAIVDLAFDDDGSAAAPTLERTANVDALAALVPQAVRFAIDEGERHKRELEMLLRLVTDVPTYRLVRRRDFALLGNTVDALLSLLPGAAEEPTT
jgi:hypothetical protein